MADDAVFSVGDTGNELNNNNVVLNDTIGVSVDKFYLGTPTNIQSACSTPQFDCVEGKKDELRNNSSAVSLNFQLDSGSNPNNKAEPKNPDNCVYFVTGFPEGKLLYIDTTTRLFHEFPPIKDEVRSKQQKQLVMKKFRSVSAQSQSVWALTDDGLIYMYLFPTNSKIRHQVHTYENQRYRVFMGGWTHKLLPVDRYAWSSRSGLQSLPRESFQLLNPNCWEWEADWRLAEVMDGQPTEQDGWLYAGNFTRHAYGPQNALTFVRRRKWIRYMTYSKYSQWALIELNGKVSSNIESSTFYMNDCLEEGEFVDRLAVGGSRLNGAHKYHLSVWVVTSKNKIFFREGVSYSRPEGTKWRHIESPIECLISISVSPMGATWALTWNGRVAVRTEISAHNPIGSKWLIIDSPRDQIIPRFQHLSLGEMSAWAVSCQSQKVYYLPNVKAKFNDLKWIEVVGEMYGVYVGLNNQVFAISVGDRSKIFFRDQVKPEELCGRSWKKVEVALNQVKFWNPDPELGSCSFSQQKQCKVREISATSFDWGTPSAKSSVPLNWFTDSPKFNISTQQRHNILNLLIERNSTECKSFSELTEFKENMLYKSNFEGSGKSMSSHVEVSTNLTKTTKNGHLKVVDKFSKCIVTMGIENKNGCKNKFLNLIFDRGECSFSICDVACVRHIHNLDHPTLVILLRKYSMQNHRHDFSIIFQTYKELFTWMDDFYKHKLSLIEEKFIKKQSLLFFVDELGYCLASGNFVASNDTSPKNSSRKDTFDWFPVKGHFRKVFSTGQFVFGLTDDKSVWLYRGDVVAPTSVDSSQCTSKHLDYVTVCIEEIEKWNMAVGYHGKRYQCSPDIFWNSNSASNKSSSSVDDDFSFVQPPSTLWEWTSNEWTIDFTNADNQGWSYGNDTINPKNFHSKSIKGDFLRKRTHKRCCVIKQNSNWHLLSKRPAIVDIAVICGNFRHSSPEDSSRVDNRSDTIFSTNSFANLLAPYTSLIWALDEDGLLFKGSPLSLPETNSPSTMTHECSTSSNETNTQTVDFILQNFTWKHLLCDHSLISISATYYSGGPIVMGLSSDGITLLVCYNDYFNPMDGPSNILPPQHQHEKRLVQVCCGGDQGYLLVRDCHNTLWFRDGTSWDFPEGCSWSKFVYDVLDVSIDQDNTIWVILKSFMGRNGVLAQVKRRLNGEKEGSKDESLSRSLCFNRNFEVSIVHSAGSNLKYISAHSYKET